MAHKKEHIHEHHHDEFCEHHHHHEHEHEHHHHHEEGGLKGKLIVIIATVTLLVAAVIIEKKCNLKTWQLLLVYLVPYLLTGWETLKEAVEGLVHGDAFNEHFLMSIATIGALCIGFLPGAETQFPEAVFVMLFFQVGELFEGYAEGKSKESIAHLMDIRPDKANVEREGNLLEVSPEEVAVGETIVVRVGEKVPLDGVILEGTTSLNTVALTGESMPREAGVGDEVISGCVNLSGAIKVRTTKSFKESTASKIIDLVENAAEKKSKSETFITRFARIYTPIVVCAAALLAFLPPLLSGSFSESFSTWLYRALMFLVVSCPCALVISVPLTFFGGIGGASRKGILIKGASYMDILSKVKTVVFDKTGTLTQGKFAVEAVHTHVHNTLSNGNSSSTMQADSISGKDESCCNGNCSCCSQAEDPSKLLLHLAAHVEHLSTHPIGSALRDAFPQEASDGCQVSEIEEIAGQGAKAKVKLSPTYSQTQNNGKEAESFTVRETHIIHVGNEKLMESIGAHWHPCTHNGTIIHIAIDGAYAGHIIINDQIKEDSLSAIHDLGKEGVIKTVMLTGDRKEVALQIAEKLHISEYHAELMPADKVGIVEQILKDRESDTAAKGYLAFVGDGINDAPVLARADVGIAMGALGSDAAIEAADVVLMDDKPSKIASAIKIAKRTLSIARQNIWLAVGIKVAVLILAALGIATMWMAVFADVGVTVLAVLNAMRALKA